MLNCRWGQTSDLIAGSHGHMSSYYVRNVLKSILSKWINFENNNFESYQIVIKIDLNAIIV